MMTVIGFAAASMIEIEIDDRTYFVPNEPNNRHRQMIAEWEDAGNTIPPYVPSNPDVADVKSEAGRRIAVIMPDYKQRNVLAFGLETVMAYGADPSQWPEPLQQVNADMQAKWGAIKAIRVRSDEIEAMDPIPADFRNDSYW
jgi:hypothetical protein